MAEQYDRWVVQVKEGDNWMFVGNSWHEEKCDAIDAYNQSQARRYYGCITKGLARCVPCEIVVKP